MVLRFLKMYWFVFKKICLFILEEDSDRENDNFVIYREPKINEGMIIIKVLHTRNLINVWLNMCGV